MMVLLPVHVCESECWDGRRAVRPVACGPGQRRSPVSRAVFHRLTGDAVRSFHDVQRSEMPVTMTMTKTCEAGASPNGPVAGFINVTCATWLRHVSTAERQEDRHNITASDVVLKAGASEALGIR